MRSPASLRKRWPLPPEKWENRSRAGSGCQGSCLISLRWWATLGTDVRAAGESSQAIAEMPDLRLLLGQCPPIHFEGKLLFTHHLEIHRSHKSRAVVAGTMPDRGERISIAIPRKMPSAVSEVGLLAVAFCKATGAVCIRGSFHLGSCQPRRAPRSNGPHPSLKGL